MRNLLKYLSGYQLESILGPLFKLFEAGLELMVPLVMARVIDIGIKDKDMGYVLGMGALLFLLGAVGFACSLTAQYFAAKAAAGFGAKLRSHLFRHCKSLSYAEVDKVGTSTMITRMTSDVNQVQSGVNLFLRLFLRSPFIVLGAMIMAFTIDVRSALIFAAAIPLLSLIVFGIMAVSMPLYKKVQRQLDRVLLTARENLGGARVIRAFNRQEDEIAKFDGENTLLVKFQVFVGKISALMNPVTYVVVNGAIIALLWTGALQVNTGKLTQGEVVALVNYMSQILVELIKLANLIVTISKSLACADRISSLFDLTPSVRDESVRLGKTAGLQSDRSSICVEFRDVDFLYAGSREPVLSGISMKIPRGGTVGVIGGTGAGKTTLVNLIPRFYDAAKGGVYLNGTNVREFPLETLRKKIGVVPQKAALFKGTLRENMKWGKEDASDQEIFEALKTAQAADFVEEKGMGLDLPIDQGGKNLSGGQRQRLTIARALVRKPEILIMDDSSSALDFATDARLRKAISESTGDMTVFIVSQRAATVKNADLIAVLDDGKIAGLGSHRELLDSCTVYREICLSQLSAVEVG